MEKKYYYLAGNKKIEISEEISKEFKKLTNREHYLKTQSYKYELSYEEISETLPDKHNIEDAILLNLDVEKLYEAINKLNKQDFVLLSALFFKGMSERQIAQKLGISQKTVNKRKQRILRLLKIFLEN